MGCPVLQDRHRGAVLAGLLSLLLFGGSAFAQSSPVDGPPAAPNADRDPRTPQTPAPPSRPTPVSEPNPLAREPSLAPGQFGGDTGGATAALGAPNMLGDLLLGTRSLQFFYSRGPAGSSPLGVGSTSIQTSLIADNNSPLPRDRIYFRYNLFADAQSVVGLTNQPVPVPAQFLPPNSSFSIYATQTRLYDTNQYTFGGEKTFADGLASLEVRVPVATTLSSKLNFIPGIISGPDPAGRPDDNGNPAVTTQTIPGGTLGNDATALGNLSLIAKGLFWTNDSWSISGGLGLELPTAPNTRYRIVDFQSANLGPSVNSERLRILGIDNDIFNLAPFLAGLWTPCERWFLQGFTQLDLPVGSNRVAYHVEHSGNLNLTNFVFPSEAQAVDRGLANGTLSAPPFTQKVGIRDQSLLHLDLGTGFWLKKDPGAFISGIVPTLELHYTTTLENAQVIPLRGDAGALIFNPALPLQTRILAGTPQVPEPGPLVGNLRNRLDILDLTVGVTVMLGDQVSIANGFAVPLRGGDNRTFDWEYQLQLNWYFGASRAQTAPAPNF